MRALHNYNNHQSRHSGQAQRDPESSHKGTGSPPQRERRLDTGLRRYDKICGFVRLCKALYFFSSLLDTHALISYHLYKTYTGDTAVTTKISTADARKNLSNIVNRVSFGKEPIILTRRGEEIAALVGMDELKLLQEIEDRIDIADAIKAIKEPGDDIPAEQFWKKLGL